MASIIRTNGRDRLRDVPLEIPSRGILAIKVVLSSRSCAAAPFGPPITQLVSRSAALIWGTLGVGQRFDGRRCHGCENVNGRDIVPFQMLRTGRPGVFASLFRM